MLNEMFVFKTIQHFKFNIQQRFITAAVPLFPPFF